ncbi:M48 family metallopeptidase [Porphyromonas sp.]|uniref:M48 family metallopeptidase n=1 Tax=Porphyromonas sp. TaxID=1924944 RepID=UPI0026DB97A6|nr:M48 family metallopeptidase [Porphyromonas sp.]MDO4695880.1 M48 family metallopeptidase [Porphyromonas sp.]MDO4770778.1 M48 family metallopeptidase [Porphyromonas sp.]
MRQFSYTYNNIKTWAFALVFISFFAGCSSVPLTGRNRINLVSDNVVLETSFRQYNDFMRKAPISDNARQTDRVRRIGVNIARATESYLRSIGMASEVDKFKWEFNLVKSNEVNAFCMPGGKIVVYEGLLKYAATDDELATVMSHEVAHALAKHANERMSQQMMKMYGAQVLSVALYDKSYATRQIASLVYGLGSDILVMLPYSRTHEYEADRIGLYLMTIAGYDPASAVTFWQKMSAGKGGDKGTDMFSTHPSDAARIKAIKEELPKINAALQGQRSEVFPQPKAAKRLETQETKAKGASRGKIKTHY